MPDLNKEDKKTQPRDRVTRDDVALAAKVSTATVSRVFNNKSGVDPQVRERVLATARDMSYVPQAAARHLSQAKTDTIGVVFQDLTPGWLISVFQGIMARCSGLYHVLNSLSTRAGDEFELPNRLLAEGRVDGLIWLDQRVTPRMVSKVKELNVPFVLIQMMVSDPQVNWICMENSDTACEAVRHLLQLGRRRILLVTGPRDNADSNRKLEGAMRAFREFGVNVPDQNILEGHHVANLAVKALSERWSNGPRPDAIFAFNDDMAIALLMWLRERGIRVPEEVALVGFDGIPESRFVGLTTVETPMYDMGAMAAQVLIEAITGRDSDRRGRQVLLKGRLCIRDTCGGKNRPAAEEVTAPPATTTTSKKRKS